METNETPETIESTELSFGKEIAKSLVLSAVISTGVVAGFAAVGLAITKFEDIKKKRAEKKAAKTEWTVKED